MADNDDIQEATRRIKEAIETGAKELSLKGLEGVTSLSDLDVDIAAATSVTDLNLSGTQITDLTPIAGMTRITELFLNTTQITNITPIAGMTGITTLNLSNTQITDFTPIAGMTEITTLYLSNTQITDLAPIAALTAIRILLLDSTQITDLRPIAGMTRITWLSLDNTQINDLTPIAGMTGITTLYLNNTPITDITPITGMTGTNLLHLNNTQITNLRPLQSLTWLRDDPRLSGLTFKNCKASDLDPRIAEIAKIEDNTERAGTLFDYLKDWVPPVPTDADQARSYQFDGSGPIQSSSSPTDDDDPDQKELQENLQTKVAHMGEAIGGSNELGQLAASVDSYARQINRPLSELRLKLLYSAANSLRVAYEAHNDAKEQARDMECLPPLVAAALQDVVETHALFFMGFPKGIEIHQTMMSGLTGQRQPDTKQLATELAEALRGQDNVMVPDDQAALIDDAIAASGEGPSAEIGERSLLGSLGNALGAVGRFVWKHKGKLAGIPASAYGVLSWMVEKEIMISTFLAAYQGPMAAWFKAMIEFVKPWI